MDERERVSQDAGLPEDAGAEILTAEAEDGAAAESTAQGGTAAEAVKEEAAAEDAEARTALLMRVEGYARRAVDAEARAAAASMGVPANRLDHVAKLAALSGIDPEDEGAREAIARAVRAVLGMAPELAGGAGTGRAAPPRRAPRDAFLRGFLGE